MTEILLIVTAIASVANLIVTLYRDRPAKPPVRGFTKNFPGAR